MSQEIFSGVADQYVYFFAADATDFVTPETGLSSFTVRRSRNGGASAAFTTPTINETDVTNMPGWYELLMDEDTALDSGDHSQNMALHITHAGMAPARLVVIIKRPDVTAGETLTVASGIGQASVQSVANNAITAAAIATGAIDADAIADNAIDAGAIAADAFTAAKFASDVGTEIGTAVWATAARTLTALDEDNTTLDLDATIRAAVGLASANLDTQIGDLPTNAELATSQAAADDATLAAIAALETHGDSAWATATGFSTLDANAVSVAVWNVAMASHLGAGTTGDAIFQAAIHAINIDDVALPALEASVADLPTNAELATALGTADDAVLTAIGDLPTNAELATALGTADDAVLAAIAALNNVSVAQILTTQMTEAYAADGVAPTLAQALFFIHQKLSDFAISSTTMTVKKLDGSTTAATLTLDDATSPTALARTG